MKKTIVILFWGFALCGTAFSANGEGASIEEAGQPRVPPVPLGMPVPLVLAPPVCVQWQPAPMPEVNPPAIDLAAARAAPAVVLYPQYIFGGGMQIIGQPQRRTGQETLFFIMGAAAAAGVGGALLHQTIRGGQMSPQAARAIPIPVETPKMPKKIEP